MKDLLSKWRCRQQAFHHPAAWVPLLLISTFQILSYRLIFTVHDTDYRASQKDFNSFLEALTQKVIEADDTVPELPVKDIVSCHDPCSRTLVIFSSLD
jgi:hypothetical protein